MQKDKYIKQAPHSYNLPSTMEVKKGNAFHGGRYVRILVGRKLGVILAGKKLFFRLPVPCSIVYRLRLRRRELVLSPDLMILV